MASQSRPTQLLKYFCFGSSVSLAVVLMNVSPVWGQTSSPPDQSTNTGAEPPDSSLVLDFSQSSDPSQMTVSFAAVTFIDVNGGKALKVDYEPSPNSNVSVKFRPSGGGWWNLSQYTGVQAQITNNGNAVSKVVFRVANDGDWQNSPWNVEAAAIYPGATKAIKVTFGKSWGGKDGFALDPSKVIEFTFYVEKPAKAGSFTVSDVKGFK